MNIFYMPLCGKHNQMPLTIFTKYFVKVIQKPSRRHAIHNSCSCQPVIFQDLSHTVLPTNGR